MYVSIHLELFLKPFQIANSWCLSVAQFNAQSFYDPPVDFLGAVGDFSRFNAVFPGEGAYIVTLTFVAS
jgi:hypothetical protein